MNLLHPKSFFLGDLNAAIHDEIINGFHVDNDLNNLKNLLSIIISKHDNVKKSEIHVIPPNMTINKKNRLPIDKILSTRKKRYVSK